MTTLTRMKNGKPVEYVNSQYIPAFLFLPVDILVLLPRELQTLSRSVQDLLHDPKTIATVESYVFWSGVMIGYSLMVWPAMGQEETPESYSYNDPAHLLSATPSCWVGMLERAGLSWMLQPGFGNTAISMFALAIPGLTIICRLFGSL